MANRTKTERNEKILELAGKGWRHKSIAKMFKMTTTAISMVIWRARHKNHNEEIRE